MTGFEPATSRATTWRSNQAELHPPLRLARLKGLEPLTRSLEGCRSIQLSYRRSICQHLMTPSWPGSPESLEERHAPESGRQAAAVLPSISCAPAWPISTAVARGRSRASGRTGTAGSPGREKKEDDAIVGLRGKGGNKVAKKPTWAPSCSSCLALPSWPRWS